MSDNQSSWITIPLGWLTGETSGAPTAKVAMSIEELAQHNKQKVAISLPALIRDTNSFSLKNVPGCVPTLLDSDPKQLFLKYNVKCQLKTSAPLGHTVQVKFDVTKVEQTQKAADLDVKLSCSCPAHVWWSAEYNLSQRDALLGEPRGKLVGPTKDLDLRTNFVLCIAPGTRVLMADGTEKLIEDVQVGDYVMTHKGHPRRVTHTAQRPSLPNEMGWAIEAKGCSDPLVVSSDHPLATVRGNEICHCGCNGTLPQWKKAEVPWGRRFLSGHAPPTHQAPRKLSDSDVLEIMNSTDNQYVLAARFGVAQATICRVKKGRIVRPSPSIVEDCSKGKLRWVTPPELNFRECMYFPKIEWQGTKEVNSDLASLLGYYTAEGNPIYRKFNFNKKQSGRPITKGVLCNVKGVPALVYGICFTLNQDESETLAEDIKEKLLRLLGEGTDVQIKFRSYSGKKWLNVIVNNAQFASDMIRLAGCGSLEKRLAPEVFEWSMTAIEHFVSSYALGDGHFDAAGQQYVYSISPHIISQVSTILYSMGIWHGRLHQDWQGKKGLGKRKKHRYYRLYWGYARYPRMLELMKGRLRPHVLNQLNNSAPVHAPDEWGEGFTRVLYSATEVTAPGVFHDLTVDEDESFIANGVVVHNCKHSYVVFTRILPSVQHNIVKILRERTILKNKEKNQQVPEKLQKKLDEMKERQQKNKGKGKEIQEKLLDALREKDEEKELEDSSKVERSDTPAVPVIDTPKLEELPEHTPAMPGDMKSDPEETTDLLAEEENKLHKEQEKEHEKIKQEPHLHTGLPYETEETKKEHHHKVPTDRELLKALQDEKQKPNGMKQFTDNKYKRRKSSLEESMLASLAEEDDDVRGD